MVKAEARNVRLTPRKARLVIDLVRNKDAKKALSILSLVNKKAAPIISKVISSAMANAKHNFNMSEDKLYVSSAYINAGPLMKRVNPKARGRADSIVKKISHVTVYLSEREVK